MPTTKIIICNLSALRNKYLDLTPQIQSALNPIIAADKADGITTTVVYVDDAQAMQEIGVAPVTDSTDNRQNKVTIDGIYNHYTPNYMMLLGAPDIIPHQSLVNPTTDDDPDVPSDLPYACSAGYSRNITDFLAPTRIVSRLPDILGVPSVGPKDPTYFLRVLAYATDRRQSPKSDYQSYFSVSCDIWQQSTSQSLSNIFENSNKMALAPPNGPDWPSQMVAPPSHFINCHGSSNDPKFYGQQGNNYPVAMDASLMANELRAGVVMSAECCYGAQLYNPNAGTKKISMGMGMCNTYLYAGSKGYFGSSNIAYGPLTGNGAADLLTQYFLSNLLASKSIGEAVLNARLRFANGQNMTSPTNLKTLASFNLMGDPVMTPVASQPPLPSAFSRTEASLQVSMLKARALAEAIEKGSAYAEFVPTAKPSPAVHKFILDLLTKRNIRESKLKSFLVRWPTELAYSVQVEFPEILVHEVGFRDPDIMEDAPFDAHIVVVIHESRGEVLSTEEFHSK